jgi:hypothetical protein
MSGESLIIDGKAVAWSGVGLRKQEIEPGTGYHIPEGSLAVFSGQMRGESPIRGRSRVNADRIKDWMLAVSRDGTQAIPSLASVCS